MAKKYELTAEIFAVGRWNGWDFTVEDLVSIVTAFHSLAAVHKVPLKFGHNDEQPMTDGQPALGWVDDVWVNDSKDKVLARFIDVPEPVYKAMEDKLYRHVSVELDLGVDHKGSHYPWVLSGVALLGADIPAVNTLSDLTSYMGRDLAFEKRVVFSTIQGKQSMNHRGGNMDDKERISTLEAELKSLKVQMTGLIDDKTALTKENAEFKAELKAREVADAGRQRKEARQVLLSRLETLVKERKITPATRDEYMRDYDDAEDPKIVEFAVTKLEKAIDSNPAYFGAEQARKKAEQEENESSLAPAQIVLQRARDYMVKNGEKNFNVARQAVLRADLDLAERYTKGGH